MIGKTNRQTNIEITTLYIDKACDKGYGLEETVVFYWYILDTVQTWKL